MSRFEDFEEDFRDRVSSLEDDIHSLLSLLQKSLLQKRKTIARLFKEIKEIETVQRQYGHFPVRPALVDERDRLNALEEETRRYGNDSD